MIEIIPAVLPKSFKELTGGLEHIRGISRKVQIDIVGGGFFSRKRTWPFRDKSAFERMLKEERDIPHWTEFELEFDLMVEHPKELAQKFIELHAARIIVHARFEGALEAVEMLYHYDEDDRPFPIGIGVALGAHASPEEFRPFENMVDFVQVMGIDSIGKQGEPPDKHGKAVELVERLRARYPELTIQVDGGVAPRVHEFVQAGANRLVVGSAIIRAQNPREVFETLYTEANGALS
jgi:ribulose-phosphate 3-epimerase